jgi:chromosome segregation ATPase
MRLLEEERSTKAEDLRKVADLEKELETPVDSKKQLLAEIDTLRKALQDLQEKTKSSEQETTDRFTTQLKSTAEMLAKETQKTTALNTMISHLKGGESTARLEADKAKKENKALNERYSNQATEHAKAFAVSDYLIMSLAQTILMCPQKVNEQTKQVESLKVDLERRQKENTELKERLAKLADLEEQITGLNREKSTLSERVNSLTTELEAGKSEASKADTKVEGLMKKVEGLDQELEQLESAHNKLLGKMKENMMAVQTSELLKTENAQLKAIIDELKASKGASVAIGGSSSPKNEKATREQEARVTELENALQEWTELAKVISPMAINYQPILTYHTALLQRVQGNASHLQEGRSVPPASRR